MKLRIVPILNEEEAVDRFLPLAHHRGHLGDVLLLDNWCEDTIDNYLRFLQDGYGTLG